MLPMQTSSAQSISPPPTASKQMLTAPTAPATEIAFQYDRSDKKWVRCPDDIAKADIEKLPIVLLAIIAEDFLHEEDKYVYCNRHRAFEKIPEDGAIYLDGHTFTGNLSELKFFKVHTPEGCKEIISLNGCKHSGLFAAKKIHVSPWGCPAEFLPFRWRIFQTAPGKPLNIAADVAKVQMSANKNVSIKWITVAYSVDIANKKIVATQSKIFEEWDRRGNSDIPKEVVGAAMELMRSDAELDSGLKPSVLSEMDGRGKIEAFAERPFDLNIVYLKTFFKDFGNFDVLFPRDAKDNYQKICEFLEIKPPKSLRKAYTFNPYSIIWYMFLRQIGVEDINLMIPFFSLKNYLIYVPLDKLYYSATEGKVAIDSNSVAQSAIEKMEWAKFYIEWLLGQRKTKKLVKWVYEVSDGGGVEEWQWDILRAFNQYFGKLSDAIKARLLRDGLTRYVHDIISWEVIVITSHWQNEGIQYPQSVLDYECRVNGYEFHVIRETMHLTHLGHMFKNCVATYRSAVLNRESIIVSAQKDRKYIACIEIRGTYIVQALGICNQLLTGDDLLACRAWAKRNHLDLLQSNHLRLPANTKDLEDIVVEECVETPPALPEVGANSTEEVMDAEAVDMEE